MSTGAVYVLPANIRELLGKPVRIGTDDLSVWTGDIQGQAKLLSAAGSPAILFNGIKESWRLKWKILVSKCFLVTHYSPFSAWK